MVLKAATIGMPGGRCDARCWLPDGSGNSCKATPPDSKRNGTVVSTTAQPPFQHDPHSFCNSLASSPGPRKTRFFPRPVPCFFLVPSIQPRELLVGGGSVW